MPAPQYDLIIKNARVVSPSASEVVEADIAIANGRFAAIAPGLDVAEAREHQDAGGLLAFPGAVDAHMHTGIYAPLDQDAGTESRAAAMGGVTSSINYMRTGQYYLNKGGPYAEFFPEVLELSAGRFHVDYCYHLAPMDRTHIGEIPMLASEFGVTSFKIFMFYGSHGLHGRSDDQSEFLMIAKDEKYDIAHFEFVMRGIREAQRQHPDIADEISLSLHCETAEIMAAYTKIVEDEGRLSGLPAYHASRPPHSEGLAIFIASYLANETDCPNINLLHLTSRKAIDAAMQMAGVFPHINFRREVTVGHLLLDIEAPAGPLAKVNPPIRPREDVEYLWQHVLDGNVDWVTSDHACCKHEKKVDGSRPDEIFLAKSGFGGTEYLVPGFFSEATKRGMAPNRIAELLCLNPARRYGLAGKGDIAVGLDADLALLDPNETWTVRAADSESSQEYSPFEGQELTGRIKGTWLRGRQIYDGSNVIGEAGGRFLHRPYAGTAG